QRVQSRIAIELPEEIEIRKIFDVDDAAKSAGQVVLRVLVFVAPLLPRFFTCDAGIRIGIVNGVRIQLVDLHVLRWEIANVHTESGVVLRVDVGVDRGVGGIAERHEVAELEARAEAIRKEDARDEKSLRAIFLSRPDQSRKPEERHAM